MSVIDVVYDPAGNDIYQYSKPVPISLKLVIDKSGDDKYLSNNIGPVSGWFGISLLIDHSGDDIYQGKLAANGSGIMGIGLLIDYSGKDIYRGDHFSNGAAFYGAGILLDLGDEADVYHSTSFSQGFGGPRGFGLLYDFKGNDLYRANGLTPSVYGTPAVYVSFSQGIGLDYDILIPVVLAFYMMYTDLIVTKVVSSVKQEAITGALEYCMMIMETIIIMAIDTARDLQHIRQPGSCMIDKAMIVIGE